MVVIVGTVYLVEKVHHLRQRIRQCSPVADVDDWEARRRLYTLWQQTRAKLERNRPDRATV
jgi:hypothetical protein